MTTVTLTSTDSRHAKAILLAADPGQWLRPEHLIAGRRAVGIPSQTRRGLYHWTDGITCSCYDFRRRQLPCKHVIAHRLDAIARPRPATRQRRCRRSPADGPGPLRRHLQALRGRLNGRRNCDAKCPLSVPLSRGLLESARYVEGSCPTEQSSAPGPVFSGPAGGLVARAIPPKTRKPHATPE